MNFSRNSNFFFKNYSKSSSGYFKSFFNSSFKTFMTYDLKRNISLLSNMNKSSCKSSLMVFNKIQKMTYITIQNCDSIIGSSSFLSNSISSNDGVSVVTTQTNSDLLTLLKDLFKLDEHILENGK